VFTGLVIVKSGAVVDNLFFVKRQAMNRDFDALSLVNTYGAFGTVGSTRYELEIQGTLADDPESPIAEWKTFDLPCKPGPVDRHPCILGPYHRRLDWLIWFSAMHERLRDPWLVHFAYKLLDGDRLVREYATDPFAGTPPRWVRIQRYVYKMSSLGSDTWWTRELVDAEWLVPISLETPDLPTTLARYRWPSPSVK
jgi:hypothetical protein